MELADRTLSLSVSPVHAAIILHFQTKSECCGRLGVATRVCVLPIGGWEGHVAWVAVGSESSGSRTKTWFMGLDLPQGSAGPPALLGDSTQQGHSSAPSLLSGSRCTQLLAPGSGGGQVSSAFL